MTKLIKIDGNEPITLVKNTIKAIKNYRIKGETNQVSTEEIVLDDLRITIEDSFNIKIPFTVEGFKFFYEDQQYESPIGIPKKYGNIVIYIGPKSDIQSITEKIAETSMSVIGEYQEQTFGGFISDEDLESMDTKEFHDFIGRYVQVITCESLMIYNPWEIYNALAPGLCSLLYTSDNSEQRRNEAKFILEMFCAITNREFHDKLYDFSQEEYDSIGSELHKLLRRPVYSKIIGYLSNIIRKKEENEIS